MIPLLCRTMRLPCFSLFRSLYFVSSQKGYIYGVFFVFLSRERQAKQCGRRTEYETIPALSSRCLPSAQRFVASYVRIGAPSFFWRCRTPWESTRPGLSLATIASWRAESTWKGEMAWSSSICIRRAVHVSCFLT